MEQCNIVIDSLNTKFNVSSLSIDRSKTYYKVIHDSLKHYGMHYELGLNIDPIPFNPYDTCSAGGLYFTSIKYIGTFHTYGHFVAEIQIPVDAKVYAEPNKAKADRFIIKSMIPINKFIENQSYEWFINTYRLVNSIIKHIPIKFQNCDTLRDIGINTGNNCDFWTSYAMRQCLESEVFIYIPDEVNTEEFRDKINRMLYSL
jgi:hypothetical protein